MEAASVPGAPPGGAADIAAKAATASAVEEKTDLIEFSYSYPVEAARIPGLAAWLDSDRAAQRGALVEAAQRDRAAAEKNDFPYHAHSHLQAWQRVTDTPRFLSLRSEEHTSEPQSLMCISYAVFCFQKKTRQYERQIN